METPYEDNKITSYKLTCFTLSVENRHSDIEGLAHIYNTENSLPTRQVRVGVC